MLVTINTDASWCPDTLIATYAFWAVSDNFRIVKTGTFKNKCLNPSEAESKCIINALKSVLIHKDITNVIINTDSQQSIDLFTTSTSHLRGENKETWASLRKVYKEVCGSVKITFRHVKAHTRVSDARSFVNRWCDTQAKKQLREARKNDNTKQD